MPKTISAAKKAAQSKAAFDREDKFAVMFNHASQLIGCRYRLVLSGGEKTLFDHEMVADVETFAMNVYVGEHQRLLSGLKFGDYVKVTMQIIEPTGLNSFEATLSKVKVLPSEFIYPL